jgi:hypothetical protein
MCAAFIQSMTVGDKEFYSHKHVAIYSLGSIGALKEAVKALSDASCIIIVLLDISTIQRLPEHWDKLAGYFKIRHDADSSRSWIAACVVIPSAD